MSRESRHLRMAMYDGKWVHESCAEQPGRYPRLEPSNVTPQGRTAVRQALESGHLGKRP